jgi:hypothetical protein
MNQIPEATPEIQEQIEPDTVRERVRSIRERITQAGERAGRSAEDLTIVAISKTFPMQAIESGKRAGLDHFGRTGRGSCGTRHGSASAHSRAGT